MRGGEANLNQIEGNLKNIQQQVNDALDSIKTAQQTSSTSDFMSDYNNEPSVVPKPWQDNKDLKFADGNRGRVTLSFPRIMMLLDKNIKSGNTTKNWSSIKDQLLAATSIDEVKNIIKTSGMNFSGNSVSGGTKKRRKVSKKKSKRRH